MKKFPLALICFIAGLITIPVCAFIYFKFGKTPVAVTDPAFPFEKGIVHTPLEARIKREMPSGSPIQGTPQNLAAGAEVYRVNCAFCHGLPKQPSIYAQHMYPSVPQLWKSHSNGVVGVSDDPVGETFWKVKNGIRLTGMPAYADILSEEQMWQVTLLLASADKPLPPDAQQDLSLPLPKSGRSGQP